MVYGLSPSLSSVVFLVLQFCAKKWMMVKMIVSYWMNDNGALAGDGDDGNQLSESVQVTAGSCLTCRYRGTVKAEKHEC